MTRLRKYHLLYRSQWPKFPHRIMNILLLWPRKIDYFIFTESGVGHRGKGERGMRRIASCAAHRRQLGSEMTALRPRPLQWSPESLDPTAYKLSDLSIDPFLCCLQNYYYSTLDLSPETTRKFEFDVRSFVAAEPTQEPPAALSKQPTQVVSRQRKDNKHRKQQSRKTTVQRP